jgi:hypothetical protein
MAWRRRRGGGGDNTAVAGDVAIVEPFLFVAMTVSRNVFPASAARTL